jgi:outer membrane cobalamin receptor
MILSSNIKFWVFLSIFCGLALEFWAQNPSDESNNIFQAQLSELTSLQVDADQDLSTSVTGFKEISLRETAGIVTILTENDIKSSGARDLIDVLRLIPGLDFARDVDNAIGLSVRGNWAHEGKVLILLNGISQNETSYGTFLFGHRMPLDNVERIEVIRGPGSAIYGGLASLAVINIITKTTRNNETVLLGEYGNATGKMSRNSVQFYTLKKINNKLNIDFSGYLHNGIRSMEEISIPNGQNFNFKDSSNVFAQQFNMGLTYKSLKFRFLYDNYTYRVTDNIYDVVSRNYYGDITYTFQINDKLKLTPKLNYRYQLPWNFYNDFNKVSSNSFNTQNMRFTGSLIATYQWNEYLSIAAGTEFYDENAEYEYSQTTFLNGNRKVSYQNLALFSEITLNSSIANVTIGARNDNHSAVPSAFVPRLAITRAFEKFHVKFLYSFAFRTPTIQNINSLSDSLSIKPERTQTTEIELGFRPSKNISLNINAYQIVIKKPIVYTYDPITIEDYYVNKERTGSRGIELEAKIEGKWGMIVPSFSYYQTYKNQVSEYAIEGEDKKLLGMPQQKWAIRGSFKLKENLHFNPSFIYWGERIAYLPYDEFYEDLRLETYKPTSQLHLIFEWKNINKSGIDVNFGCYNALNKKNYFLSTTDSGYIPNPDQNREFVLKLRYHIE